MVLKTLMVLKIVSKNMVMFYDRLRKNKIMVEFFM